MATVTQRLAFLISANADQAIRAFEKTANSAQKEMAKTTRSIDQVAGSLTSFGARGLAATGTLAAGLFKLSQAAIEDQKAQQLLAQQLRVSTKATNEQIESVEEYIDTTARAVGVADDLLRPALQSLVRATGDVTKSQKLLNLALDISAGTGRDLAAVSTAIARASTGQVGALTRLGVPLSENVKRTKDFDGAIRELSDRFQGQAAIAADTYAGRLARARIAISETGEEIGEAFIPVIEKTAGALGGTANAFSGLNKSTGGAIGTFASYATIALGVVSASSLVAGQMIKMRTTFVNAEGDLNRLGKTAKTASIALSAIAVAEVAGAAVSSLGGFARETEKRLNDLLTVAGRSDNTRELTTAFAELADQLKNADTSITAIIKQFGKAIRIAGADTDAGRIAIEYLDEAFTQIAAKSPELAQSIIDALREQSKALDRNGATYKDNMMLVKRYTDQLRGMAGATDAVTTAQQQAAAADEAVAAAKRKAEEAAARYKRRIDDLRKSIRDDLNTSLDAARTQLKTATDAFNEYSNTVSNAVRATYSLGGALEENETYMGRLRKSAQSALAFSANIQRLIAMNISQDTLNMIVQAGAETGAAFADELVKGGQAAVDEADALTESVKLAGQRAGTDAASTYYQNGVTLAQNLVNGIDSIIKRYTIRLKSAGLTDKQLKRLQKNFKIDVGFAFTSSGMEIPELADGGIVPATRGGRLIRVAEAGQDEAIIPLPNSMRPTTSTTGDTNITVNVHGGDPNAVVDALRKYMRQNGAVPIRVQG